MASYPLVLDYAYAMRSGTPSGITDEELNAEEPAFQRGLSRLVTECEAGRRGFWGLPDDTATLGDIERYVASLGDRFPNVLVLGIGGSSLGARALQHALCGPPGLERSARRLHLPDNSDPWLLEAVFARLDPHETLVLVISKSGGTLETAAQMQIARAWLERALGSEAAEHIVAVTDPAEGSLRALATREGWTTFAIPSNVGGRFSVLSSVGLLPAQLLGIDTRALLAGAQSVAAASRAPALKDNPAGILAVLHLLHSRLHDRPIHVLMPYSEALRPFAAWYAQLWAESLGKRFDRQGRVIETGPTPIGAVGSTDQHSQLQLFIEGPRDKLFTFIAVEEPTREPIRIPPGEADLAYLGGHHLAEILDGQRRSTAIALAQRDRPSLTIHLRRVDAFGLGALFFLYEAATAIAGELMQIDAFDQPGVEEGKRYVSGLLGRPGYETAASSLEDEESRQTGRYRLSLRENV